MTWVSLFRFETTAKYQTPTTYPSLPFSRTLCLRESLNVKRLGVNLKGRSRKDVTTRRPSTTLPSWWLLVALRWPPNERMVFSAVPVVHKLPVHGLSRGIANASKIGCTLFQFYWMSSFFLGSRLRLKLARLLLVPAVLPIPLLRLPPPMVHPTQVRLPPPMKRLLLVRLLNIIRSSSNLRVNPSIILTVISVKPKGTQNSSSADQLIFLELLRLPQLDKVVPMNLVPPFSDADWFNISG